MTQQVTSLQSEGHLRRLLAEERARCEQHRKNYSALKMEALSAQERYKISSQKHEEESIEQNQIIERYKTSIHKQESTIRELNNQLEEMRRHAFTPQKIELLKAQLLQQAENSFRNQMALLEDDLEKYRSDFNKMRYDYVFLKTEFEHSSSEWAQQKADDDAKRDSERQLLHDERVRLAEEASRAQEEAQLQVRNLQRENTHLSERNKSLLNEVNELQERAHTDIQSLENDLAQSSVDVTDARSKIKILQSERETLTEQISFLTKELASTVEQVDVHAKRKNESEQTVIKLTNELEDFRHKSKIQLSTMRADVTKRENDLSREKIALEHKLLDCQSQVELLQSNLVRQKQLMSHHEKESNKKMQAQHQQDMHAISTLKAEKIELDEVVRAAKEDLKKAHENATESSNKWREMLNEKEILCDSLRVELATETAKVADRDAEIAEKNAQSLELTHVREELFKTQNSLSDAKNAQDHLQDDKKKLQSALEMLRLELINVNSNIERSKADAEQRIQQIQTSFNEEKVNLVQRVNELDCLVDKFSKKLRKATVIHKRTKIGFKKWADSARKHIAALETRANLADDERKLFKNMVPLDVYQQVKRDLKTLHHKHLKYQKILGTNVPSFAGFQDEMLEEIQKEFTLMEDSTGFDLDDKYDRELAEIREGVGKLNQHIEGLELFENTDLLDSLGGQGDVL